MNRINYIDKLKGIAISLVVIGHVIIFSLHKTFCSDILLYVISSFHMSLFAFLSGIVFNSKCLLNQKLIKKHLARLLLPFLFFGLLYTLCFGHSFNDFIFDNFKLGYWYLLSIFLILMLAYIFNYAFTYLWHDIVGLFFIYSLFYVLTKLLSIDLIKLFSIDLTMSLLPGFFTGYIINKYSLYSKIINYRFLIIALIIFSAILIGNYIYRFSNLPIDIFTSLLGTYIIFSLLYNKNSSEKIINKIFINLGIKSLEIYVIHYFILHFMVFKSNSIITINFYVNLLFIIVISAVVLFLSYFVSNLLSNNKISFIFFGK